MLARNFNFIVGLRPGKVEQPDPENRFRFPCDAYWLWKGVPAGTPRYLSSHWGITFVGKYSLTAVLGLAFIVLSFSQPASAIPAFARKYGLRCSACHESWPMLNYFGQKFKDNGYQLMNDKDAPIWQNPSYWPVTFRMTT